MPYSFQCTPDTDIIIEALNSHGIAIIPGFLKPDKLDTLKLSFSDLMNGEFSCIDQAIGHPNNPNGKQVFFNPTAADKDGFPEYSAIFQSGLIKNIAEAFFSPSKFQLNPQIVMTHLRPSPTPILPWHFDRMQSLKFWIYVDDATSDDGAFEYCPGTHWEGRYRAAYHMAIGTPVRYIPNDVPAYRIQNPVSVEAKAGDLIVFDPDGFHRGGVIQPGHERKVIRADTAPLKARRYSDKPLTPGWWLRSPLNLARWLKSASFRTLGDSTIDTTQIRERRK